MHSWHFFFRPCRYSCLGSGVLLRSMPSQQILLLTGWRGTFFFFFHGCCSHTLFFHICPPSRLACDGRSYFFKIMEVIYPDIPRKTDGIIFFHLSPLSPWPFPCLFYVSSFAWLVGNCLFLHGIWTKCCCWKLGVFRHSDDLKLWWAFAVLTHTVPAANSFLL